MPDIDSGPNAWQSRSNHNRMMELQRRPPQARGDAVELAHFASSAFRITSPAGLSVMLDPWRNHPRRHWDWYLRDFPMTAVDVGVSTHAHFDHDALNRLDAHVVLDRPIGTYSLLDVTITGIADKHSIDSSGAVYDFVKVHRELHGTDVTPPENPRSWDNVIVVVETGGVRIAHWGDNRHDPPPHVWEMLGRIDIALLPVDGSQHVMSFGATQAIIDRLRPRIVVPHHYYIWDVIQRQATLMPVDGWVDSQPGARRLQEGTARYRAGELGGMTGTRVDFFGDHVAFDKTAWRTSAD